MSKAFTREDDAEELPPPPKRSSPLPPGAKNYITTGGATRLRGELERCIERRARVVAADPANAKLEVQKIDQHIAALQAILDSAVVTSPPEKPWDEVRFGATVKVRDTSGEESTYRIVGVDETDIDRDWISWVSPIARALFNARVGRRVRFRVPAGERELEVLSIAYEG